MSAVIIKNKKLLLLRGDEGIYAQFYFTPGGKIEEGESEEMALRRELREELSVEIKNFKKYFEYTAKLQDAEEYQKIICFLVDIKGEIKMSGEITKVYWYGRENFDKKEPTISESMYEFLLPKLLEEGRM